MPRIPRTPDERSADFEAVAEFRRTQPALYDAITAYAAAHQRGDVDEAFGRAGEIANRVLALAAGLPVPA